MSPRYRKTTNRKWHEREMRLVREFIERFFGDYPHALRVRLGQVPAKRRHPHLSPEEERLLGVFRRMVDGVVFMPDRVILIEGMILPRADPIGFLEHYAELFPETPELAEHRSKPIEKKIVCAIEDPAITAFARTEGIGVIVWCPSWVMRYLGL